LKQTPPRDAAIAVSHPNGILEGRLVAWEACLLSRPASALFSPALKRLWPA
jgi:hypothetical protein